MCMLEMQSDALRVVEERSEIVLGMCLLPANAGNSIADLSGEAADMLRIPRVLMGNRACACGMRCAAA